MRAMLYTGAIRFRLFAATLVAPAALVLGALTVFAGSFGLAGLLSR